MTHSRFSAILPVASALCTGSALAQEPILVTGLSSPESVLHDTQADIYLVSNIEGGVADKDGTAHISRIGPDGQVLELRWIEAGRDGVTLDAPKGLALSGDSLYVADIDTVRIFDRTTGAPKGQIPIEGATFLNDLATLPNGDLIGTDSAVVQDGDETRATGNDLVYRIRVSNGQVEPIARGAALGQPNGIFVLDDQTALVATRGGAEIYELSLDDGSIGTRYPAGERMVDGVGALPDGTILATNWTDGALYAAGANGNEPERLAEPFSEPAADFGIDSARGRLLLPLLRANEVVIMPLPQASDVGQ